MVKENNEITLKLLLQSIPDLYLILDKKFNIIEASNAYLQSTRVIQKEIMGCCIFEIFTDNPHNPFASGVENLRASLQRVLNTKKQDTMAVQRYDIRIPESEGGGFEERYWSFINIPILNNNNEVIYILHRVKDVTEYIRLKNSGAEDQKIMEELKTYAGVMEVEIYRRTQKNNQLLSAKENAEKLAEKAAQASHAKSNFLASMSHEIRTPLNGVIGMTGLLLETPLTPEQSEFAEIIRVSGETLLSIINDILDFSKIESGFLELDYIDFDLKHIVYQSIEINLAHAYRKQVEINTFIEPNVPQFCIGDPVRLRQILNNLLSNAIKFTKQGEINIWVKGVEKANNSSKLLFEVEDTGIGIDPEVRDRLFQPFAQGDRSTTRKYGGTGLGLAISKRLVNLMNGEIDLKSIPGKGSTFWFTAEFRDSEHKDNQLQLDFLSELEGVRILCVDNHSTNRQIIKRTTEAWMMRCDIAESAVEALAMLKKATVDHDPFSLAIIDYRLSDISCIELIKMIRQMNEIASLHIIVLFPMGFNFGRNRLTELGITTTISKPIHPEKLYEAILKSLEKTARRKGMADNGFEEVNIKPDAHILLAEDNYINQQVCLRILSKLGLSADTVVNGKEAVNAVEKFSYDLILMDCQMPDIDGYSATTEIRKLENGKNMPIVAMTAHALKGDRERCISVGMNDYISKPINVKDLVAILAKWLPPES